MALINCPECKQKVSDKAPACPGCGCPIASSGEVRATGAPITTTQTTSKRLKLHSLGAALLLIVGVVWFLGNMAEVDQSGGVPSPVPRFLMIGGFIWFIVTRFRVWWHHR